MATGRVRAALYRGGTSKGLFLRGADLPARLRALIPAPGGRGAPPNSELDRFIAEAMGSDKYGMQLNGVGGGISSTSKVVIVDESCRSGHDVDYTFGQVDMHSGEVDWSGSCGNLASAVAIFAMDEGMVKNSNPINHNGSTLVKVFQANLESSLHITVAGQDTPQDHRIGIPGVEALGRPISVNFMHPRVGKLALLPTGNVRDSLNLSAPPSPKAKSAKIEASLVCAANPTIFVRASDMGMENSAFPLADARQDVARLQAVIQDIRDVGARAMGVRLSDAVRVSWLAAPAAYTATDGTRIPQPAADIVGCITTPGRLHHHAYTGTGAINLACLLALPDSVAHGLLPPPAPTASLPPPSPSGGERNAEETPRLTTLTSHVRLGQPAGVMTVHATCNLQGKEWTAVSAGFVRTARLLFSGYLHVS